MAARDAELRQKQDEIDRLYGKLAVGSQLTDADLRHALASALQRLTTQGLGRKRAKNSKTASLAVIEEA